MVLPCPRTRHEPIVYQVNDATQTLHKPGRLGRQVMKVFDLTNQQGFFTTSTHGQPEGHRTFGLWSAGPYCTVYHQVPEPGDLIVIQRGTSRVLYQIKRCDKDFTGTDGNEWWKGVMEDVIAHQLLTPEMVTLLQSHRLA